ncbi:hypothetical protein ACLOJK_021870 [Asimina triloba]
MRRSEIPSPSDRGIDNPNPSVLASEEEGDTARSSPRRRRILPFLPDLVSSSQVVPLKTATTKTHQNPSSPQITPPSDRTPLKKKLPVDEEEEVVTAVIAISKEEEGAP